MICGKAVTQLAFLKFEQEETERTERAFSPFSLLPSVRVLFLFFLLFEFLRNQTATLPHFFVAPPNRIL